MEHVYTDKSGVRRRERMCHYYTKECPFPAGEHTCCVTHMLDILSDISDLLFTGGVKFTLMSGTLLGWRRHGGVIPWDDDVDIACLMEDKVRVKSLLQPLKDKGYDIVSQEGKGTDTTPPYEYLTVYYSERNRVHVDVSFLSVIASNGVKYLYDAPYADNAAQKDINDRRRWTLDSSTFMSLRPAMFYNIRCFVPSKTDEQLKFWYGDDVLDEANFKTGPSAYNPAKAIKFPEAKFDAATPIPSKTKRQTPNNDLGIRKALVINLNKRRDRKQWMLNQLDSMDLWGEIVPAVTGQSLDRNTLLQQKKIIPAEQRLSMNEYACYFSHIRCWEMIAAHSKNEVFMILEDDVYFSPLFANTIRRNSDTIRNSPTIIRLGTDLYNNHQKVRISHSLLETGLGTGCYAYLLRPSQARKLLDIVYPIHQPVDLTIVAHDQTKFPTKEVYDDRIRDSKSYVLHHPSESGFHAEYTGSSKHINRLGIVGELSSSMLDSTSWTDLHARPITVVVRRNWSRIGLTIVGVTAILYVFYRLVRRAPRFKR